MRALKVLWDLLVDDVWLAGGVLASLAILAALTRLGHVPRLAGWVFAACLLASLGGSLFRERRARRKA
ncbi:MAG: hypothetical protein K6T30_10420 [Alicyclobacillus sp.]|nr:hypothetical protein [Alicyclobacillus sp.]